MSTELLDNDSETKENKEILQNGIAWWERRRVWFNIIVAISGITTILWANKRIQIDEFIALIFYALFINLFYSTGFLLEAFDTFYFKGKIKIYQYRWGLYIIGTLGSAFITYLLAYTYYHPDF